METTKTHADFDIVDVTQEEFKTLHALMFTPQKAKEYLDKLFIEKIGLVANRIEKSFNQKYCKHVDGIVYQKDDSWLCAVCEKVWR